MKTLLEYKGYLGSAEVDVEGECLAGRLLYIRDTIAYSANSVAELQQAFHEAVDDYLRVCEEEGDEPDLPLKGSFNVRVGPELHRKVATAAREAEKGLNEFVCSALEGAVEAQSAYYYVPPTQITPPQHSGTMIAYGVAQPAGRVPRIFSQYDIRGTDVVISGEFFDKRVTVASSGQKFWWNDIGRATK